MLPSAIAAETLVVILTAVKTIDVHGMASGTLHRPRISQLLLRNGRPSRIVRLYDHLLFRITVFHVREGASSKQYIVR